MNFKAKPHRPGRIPCAVCLLLAVLLCLSLPSCRREEDEGGTEPRVTVDAKGMLTFAAEPETSVLSAHAGQVIKLYELKPGETVLSISGKTPIAEERVTAKLRIRFPLRTEETGSARLYSSYLAVFSDGTLLSQAPCSLSNPERLAQNQADFPHANTIKGLNAADEMLSRALYSTHTVIELSAAALMGDSGEAAELGGVSILLDAELLAQTDRSVRAAADAGMQISLCLMPDSDAPVSAYAVLLDALAERYTEEGEGTVSALLLGASAPRTSQNAETVEEDSARAAELLRLAQLALLSRFANGRVYACAFGTPDEVKSYLLSVYRTVSDMGGPPVGFALTPEPITASMLSDGAGQTRADSGIPYLNLSDLTAIADELSVGTGRKARIAVVGLDIPADNPELQAALYTCAYRASVLAKADFLIYRSQSGEETGLYSAALAERPAARAFRCADTDSNAEGEGLAAALLSEDWGALSSIRPSRIAVQDTANFGTSGDSGRLLFDFSDESAPLFTLTGYGTQPKTVRSEALGGQALTAALSARAGTAGSGYRCTLAKAGSLDGVYVLSAKLLPQTPSETQAEITLLLDGTASDGRALSYSSTIRLGCNNWQTVSFHIRSFTSQMDSSAPCTVTLLMNPEYTPDGSFALWLHSANTRRAVTDYSALWLGLLIAACFAVGLAAVLLLFRTRRRAVRRRTDARTHRTHG